MKHDQIFLDHAAATPLAPAVLEAMTPYFSELFYNPSSPYDAAVNVRRNYEAAKYRIAKALGVKSDELIMTAGATESIALAFHGIEGHVVVSVIEHQAVLSAAAPHDATRVPVDHNGRVNSEAIKQAIRPDTELVSIALANGEIGTIQPLRDIASVIKAERQRRFEAGESRPIYFHSDASQGAGLIDVHAPKLGLDLLTINAGKIYGPKQTALLWAAPHVVLKPLIGGGGQERGLRSGTENVAGVVGFATAIERAIGKQKSEAKRLAKLRDMLENELVSVFPDAVVSGHRRHRLPSHLHISFPNVDAERLVFRLESRGVFVATGSACAANKGLRSHVLTGIGLDPVTADGSLRLSLGVLSGEKNTQLAAKIIIEEVTAEKERSAK